MTSSFWHFTETRIDNIVSVLPVPVGMTMVAGERTTANSPLFSSGIISSPCVDDQAAVFSFNNSLGTPVMSKADYAIGTEIYENMPFDEESGNLEITIPMSRVARLASNMAFDECAEYFQMIRDSLKNVLLDTDRFIEQRDLLNDEAFWRALIFKVTQTPKSEGELWDCKEILNMWHAKDATSITRMRNCRLPFPAS